MQLPQPTLLPVIFAGPDPSVSEALCRFLALEGIAARITASIDETFDLLDSEDEPGLVVYDDSQRGGSRRSAGHRLAALKLRLGRTPLLIIAPPDTEGSLAYAMADLVLPQPIDVEVLVYAIQLLSAGSRAKGRAVSAG
jgi:DNA-binding NarL/FixJ family response regulator